MQSFVMVCAMCSTPCPFSVVKFVRSSSDLIGLLNDGKRPRSIWCINTTAHKYFLFEDLGSRSIWLFQTSSVGQRYQVSCSDASSHAFDETPSNLQTSRTNLIDVSTDLEASRRVLDHTSCWENLRGIWHQC